MILLCGIPTESPIALVRSELDDLELPYAMFNQRDFEAFAMEFEIAGNHVSGRLKLGSEDYRMDEFTGVYTRLMDDQSIPELKGEPENSPKRRYCRSLHETLIRWCEVAPIRIVNRYGPMGSNSSKPYQIQLIRGLGFLVPETLITNDPSMALDFFHRHQRVIYKSISSVRSIVQTMEARDLPRLHQIRWCPVQFQEYVEGTNVRVHVIGTKAIATSIITDVPDYRYAHRLEDSTIEVKETKLPVDVEKRCIGMAQALKLDFAGIDLKITPDQRVYCFEVNPSPAFSYFESNSGQPIARTLVRYLAGED